MFRWLALLCGAWVLVMLFFLYSLHGGDPPSAFPPSTPPPSSSLPSSPKPNRNDQLWDGQPASKLFVAVLTSPRNLQRRMHIRETWMGSQEVKRGDVQVRFFIGTKAMDQQMYQTVSSEAEKFGDVVFLEDLEENYYHLLLKLRSALRKAAHLGEFFLRANDDALILPDRMLKFIDEKLLPSSTKYIYAGFVHQNSALEGFFRDPTHEWYIPVEDFPGSHLPDYVDGAACLMSRGLAMYFAENVDLNVKAGSLEDIQVGIEMNRFRTEHGLDIRYVHEPGFTFNSCQKHSIIVHPIFEENLKCSWKRYLLKKKAFCCEPVRSEHRDQIASKTWADENNIRKPRGG
ncbi:hypothetical protein QOT17_007572 [Balamuthia mandrillaris]